MPAGLVLMVMATGLFVAMLLNAPATLRKSNGKVDNSAWRTSVAEGVDAVSSFFFLDEPRIAVDEALGRNQTTDQAIEEVVAEATEDVGPVTPDATPVLRTPTPSQPLRVYIAGDSMAGGLADTFVPTSQASGLVLAEDGHRVSSGLSRPDFFNWPQFLARDIDPQNGWDPDVLVIGFGANDLQNIPVDGGGLTLGSQEWLDEYRARVAGTMDLVRSGDDDRVTIWMGLPPMGPRSGIDPAVVDQVNAIYRSEAEGRPWIDYLDSWSYLSGADGAYAEQLPMANGEVRRVRASDDIHFDVAGSQRLTWAVLDRIGGWTDLSAAADALVPPAGQAAPADVAERTELPDPGA
jgi:hypothetical protein